MKTTKELKAEIEKRTTYLHHIRRKRDDDKELANLKAKLTTLKEVLKLIDKAEVIITGNIDGELISKKELKKEIKG